jgi:AcrR family transcriptional regulator
VTETIRQRRQPVQGRSRETVARVLAAAAELITEGGVSAATTRAMSARSGVSVPSLYRFFADRDEIFDRLLKAQLDEFDRYVEESAVDWEITSIPGLVSRIFELYVAYNEAHPVFTRLWFGGRASPTVVAEVQERNRILAQRAQAVLVAGGLLDSDTSLAVLVLAIELGDRVLELAFRDGQVADRSLIEQGCVALTAYLERVVTAAR